MVIYCTIIIINTIVEGYMYKVLILVFVVCITYIKAIDYVPFSHEGYTSTYGSKNLYRKSTSKKVDKYNIFISYEILARWKSSFLIGDPVLYADFIYKITDVTIYVDSLPSPYNLMGASTGFERNLETISFIKKEKSKILKNLVRISGLKIKITFNPKDNSLSGTFIVDGGVGAKNYDGDSYFLSTWSDQKFLKEKYLKINSKYRSYNTQGSPMWSKLFLYRSTLNLDEVKQRNIETTKKIGHFHVNGIEDIVFDLTKLISFVENNILFKKPLKKEVESSLLLLIDASGSMRGSKFEAAKKAAISNMKKAISKNVEVSVAFFGGDCSSANVLHVHGFSLDKNSLMSFIQNAHTMGGTPLSLALKQANEFLYAQKSKSSKSERIILLGDGEGSCGNIDSVIDTLKSNNTFAHHETIGLEVGNNSSASSQLRNIASQSDGDYHSSASVEDLERVFEDAADIEELSNMIGRFGDTGNSYKSIPTNNSMQSILNDFE